jgi:hypothetical protein
VSRADLRLDAEQRTSLLARANTAAVAISGDDGYPLVAVARVVDGGAAIVLDADGPLAAALADGRALCVTVDDWPTYDGIQGLLRRGRVRPDGDGFALIDPTDTSFDFAKAAQRP